MRKIAFVIWMYILLLKVDFLLYKINALVDRIEILEPAHFVFKLNIELYNKVKTKNITTDIIL